VSKFTWTICIKYCYYTYCEQNH